MNIVVPKKAEPKIQVEQGDIFISKDNNGYIVTCVDTGKFSYAFSAFSPHGAGFYWCGTGTLEELSERITKSVANGQGEFYSRKDYYLEVKPKNG